MTSIFDAQKAPASLWPATVGVLLRPDAPAHACRHKFNSRLLILPAIMFAISPITFAASNSSKPKTRSLKTLVDIALSTGSQSFCPENVFSELGISDDSLTSGNLPVKSVSYKQKISTDHKKHIFSVAIHPNDKDKIDKPLFLIWDTFAVREESGEAVAEGYSFRVSLDGKILNAISIRGPVGDGKHAVLDIDSREVKKSFKHETDFYTHDSIPLEITTK